MNWQDWTTIVAVGTASIFIARKLYRSMTTRAGCGCSHECGGSSNSDLGIQRQQIIPIDELKNKTRQGAK